MDSKPTNVPNPTRCTNAALASMILDGIGGHQQSLARWALSEMQSRLAAGVQMEEAIRKIRDYRELEDDAHVYDAIDQAVNLL